MTEYLVVAGTSVRQLPNARSTVFGDQTLFWTDDDGGVLREAQTGTRSEAGISHAQGRLHLVVQSGTSFREDFPEARVVLDKGRYLAVDLTEAEADSLIAGKEQCYGVIPLPADTAVVVNQQTPAPNTLRLDQQEAELAAEVSENSLEQYLSVIAGHFTRHSLRLEFQTAADWAGQFLQTQGYSVSEMPIVVGAGRSTNVIADKQGIGGELHDAAGGRGLVLVTAHLDSINHPGGPASAAPGADDNGSGSAGVLEIGRILATRRQQHDLRLILFGGEEQGLHGSKALVAALSASDRQRLTGVINMDMVGTVNGTAGPTVMIEGGENVSEPLMETLAAVAHSYTGLTVQTSLNPFASDHVPFINAGLPAVLTIEGSDSVNTNIHTAGDTLDKINYALAAEIVRMNLVTAARMLGVAGASRMPGGQGSSPVVSTSPGRLDIFGTGTDGTLLHKRFHL